MKWPYIGFVLIVGHAILTQQDDSLTPEDIRPSIINEGFDIVLAELWSVAVSNNLDRIKLPDLHQDLSIKPLFINYNAGFDLADGNLSNIDRLERYNDAIMFYTQRSFRIQASIIIRKVDISYKLFTQILAIGLYGIVKGIVTDTLIATDISINLSHGNITLNDLYIASFRDLNISLQSNAVTEWISSILLRPITTLFRNQITRSVSQGVKDHITTLIDDINASDRLQIKQFSRQFAAG